MAELFSTEELNRYSQHIKLLDIGLTGQTKLKAARVLCVGAGGLGSPLLLYLAAAGVGSLGIIDDDTVALSNLQRQILYSTDEIGTQKVLAAKEKILALNPNINVEIYAEKLTLNNAKEIFSQYDIIADCSDNFATRYLVNDICFLVKKPFVGASIAKFSGQCAVFLGTEGPCFRCIFPEEPSADFIPNCNENGVLGVLPGLLGVIQANEIIKWILGIGELLTKKLLIVDLLSMQFRTLAFSQEANCQTCVQRRITVMPAIENISVTDLKKLLESDSHFSLLDVRTVAEHQAGNLGGKLIPLNELPARIAELNSEEMIIVYCHSGPRSIHAAKILNDFNFKSVKFLSGGFAEWSNLT